MIRRTIPLLSALLLCLAGTASAQILSVACTPSTGPTTAGVAYSASCTASGGIAPYSWVITGTLPDGLMYTPSGDTTMLFITDTPMVSGSYNYTVQVTDSTPVIPMTATQSYSGTVAPNITSISPTSATAGAPSFPLMVNGFGFGSDSTVNFNGMALTPTPTSITPTQITVTIPASSVMMPGMVPVTVTSGGATSNSATFTINPPPMITSISPTSATAGGGQFTLTVNGSGFGADSVINFNGNALTPTSITSTQVATNVPPSLITTAGTVSVTVTSGGVTSNGANFTILPNISSISPSSVTAGEPNDFILTVNGNGFTSGAVVQWNGSNLSTTFVSGTQLQTLIAASRVATQGTVQITVSSNGLTSNAVTFIILPPPAIASITPPSITAGGPSFTLTVDGSGFVSGAVVEWNNSALSTSFVNSGELTASVPSNLIANTGSAQITVRSGGVTSNSKTITIVAGPALGSISPNTKSAGSGSFTLTANGTGFGSDAVVYWNGSALTPTFRSADQLTATVPANLVANPGTAQVTVKSGGVTSNALTFTIFNITSLNPSTAVAGGAAFTLTVNGNDFESGAVVQWNGTALATSFVSSTKLTAPVLPNLIASAGTAQVTVVEAGATSNALAFTIAAPGPTLTSISPPSITGGTGAGLGPVGSCPSKVYPAGTLTVKGTGFTSSSTVDWNGQAMLTTFVSSTELTACVSSANIQGYGTAAITVVSGRTTSNAVNISLLVPAITITGLQSTSAPTQQLTVGIQLASATPTALQGTLQLSFSSTAPGLPSGYVDPGLQFSSGGTTATFSIGAGSNSARVAMIQQGTVEGTITVTLTSLTSNGTSVLPASGVTATVSIPPLPPVITAGSVQITNLTSSGFDVVLTGYSVTRDMMTANFSFTAAAGTAFNGTTTFAVPVGPVFTTWFDSTAGQQNGSMFLLTVPFTISGPTSVLGSVSVTLTNSVGTSAAVSASP
ncbi:MAG TPA: IPT/TIG domain-containing protein [Bryobacteraceae bacterium]|nr:IPT/TIG domain-containing protein [Bryobacteraceae bacterium]